MNRYKRKYFNYLYQNFYQNHSIKWKYCKYYENCSGKIYCILYNVGNFTEILYKTSVVLLNNDGNDDDVI